MADPPPDLLQYRFSTLPSPLQVSAASASSPGAINLWAAPPPGPPVYCSKIQIAVPLGEEEAELCAQAPSVTPNTTWWTVSSLVIEGGETLGLLPKVRYALYTAVCTSDRHWPIDYDLQFSIITHAVNRREGRAGIVVAETSGTDRARLELRRTVYDVGKGPVTDYLDAVVTTLAPPAATGTPVAEFALGQPIRLAWGSNAAAFAVHVGAERTPVWTGTSTEVVLPSGVTRDSTLTIVAKGTGGGVLMASTTVTVGNPALTPRSVTAGTLDAAGTAQLAAVALASLTTGTLDATGAATLSGGARAATLGVTAGATLRGPLGAGSANVTGALRVGGAANLGAASAASLTVTGSVAMLAAPRPIIPNNSYVPSSDGFVIGSVGTTGDATKQSEAFAYGSTAGMGTFFAARGGNMLGWADGKNHWMASCAGSFLMPVRRGVGFTLWTQIVGSPAPPLTFVWVPLGTSATLTTMSDDEAAAAGLLPPRPGATPLTTSPDIPSPPVGGEVAGLVAYFADVLGDRLTPELTDRLRRAVTTLTVRH